MHEGEAIHAQRCLWKPEEGVESPGAGIIGGCESPKVGLVNGTQVLPESGTQSSPLSHLQVSLENQANRGFHLLSFSFHPCGQAL